MPKPIFVIGNQRSGTTWLANILCRHSKIVGVQKEPFGIIESAYFNGIEGYFGNLKNSNNFYQFFETFSRSEYFKLTKVDKNLLLENKAKNYVSFFRLLMDSFAKNANTDFWIEKTPAHTLYLNKISKYFRDAKFIGIKRNIFEKLKSAAKRSHFRNILTRLYFILGRTFNYYKYDKHIDKFNSHSNQIFIVDYDLLKKNTKTVITKLCEFLEIKYEPALSIERYEPNTSFTNNNERKERKMVLSSKEIKLIKWVAIIFKSLPYFIYRIIYYFQVNTRRNRLPPQYSKKS